MRRFPLSSVPTCVLFGMLLALHPVHAAEENTVRHAAVAGAFYPADPTQLIALMDQMLAQATVQTTAHEPILAAVAPHASYVYSGPVAASTYAALRGHHYKRVVVVAPSHFVGFNFTSVYNGSAYATPLGSIVVDREFAHRLAKSSPSIKLSDEGHAPTSAGGEHALEVQLPWLQHVLGSFQLVPIVMGSQSYEASRALGVALAKLIAEDEQPDATLVIASSDLSHYHRYNDAVVMDHKTLAALTAWDYFSMSRNFQSRLWEACGGAPIVAAMIFAERRGATAAELLRYANSGDTSGDKARVVGYGAAIFRRTTASTAAEPPFALAADEKQELLSIARSSVESSVRGHHGFQPAAPASQKLNTEYGAFVTLTEHGALRGCIGYVSAMKPLYETVRDVASYAALRDPRFPAVISDELSALHYEISVLSPLRHVQYPSEIVVGRDGLLIKNGDREGLLLPQVPTEQGWDRQTFLEQTCVKAGLPRRCWKDADTDIFRFTAEVFQEEGK